ncbi:hypothetical protein DSM112329_03981 [Paraconexibacter sp. AEG42_29]|uniref:Glycosyltransferase RgtA/B/C/D-like domain-containing protein n=1 Tax=Paraconexibacter sp. AEG42_29 TaxID=2997339 RepID=A0AAU7B0D5_9ACTN
MRRWLAIFLLLLVAYAATIGLRAAPGQRYSGAEAHRLLTAASISEDGDLDLRDQYAQRTWDRWDGPVLRPTAGLTEGRLVEPQGIGFPLLIAPAYALGGPTLVELQCALLLALAFTLGAALARRLVPEPWATRSALLVGLSPPALAASTTVAPVAAGAVLITGGALLALRIRERPRLRWTFWCAACLALTAWLDVHLALPGAVIAVALWRWLRRRGRAFTGFVALEVVLTSAVVFITVNDRVFGGLTPVSSRLSGGSPTGAEDVAQQLERLPRILGVFVDREAGLIRWAPVVVLALVALVVLVRSRRERLASFIADQIDVEVTSTLLALIAAAGVACAVFARPSLHGPWLAPPDVVVILPCAAALVALGLRRQPRVGAALAAVTVAGAVWFLAGARLDDGAGTAPPRGPLPLGGAERVLPDLG